MRLWLILALLISVLFTGCKKSPSGPGTEGDNPRIVLAELFSEIACTYCPNAYKALSRLFSEYDRLWVLSYFPASDTFGTYRTQNRMTYYSIGMYPTMILDGLTKTEGAPDETIYDTYKNKIEARLQESSPLRINVAGLVGSSKTTAIVTVIADEDVSGTLYCALFEDSIIYSQKKDTLYPFIVRDMESTSLNMSASDSSTMNFNLDLTNVWNQRRLGLVAFVQKSNKEVLQAGGMSYLPFEYDFTITGETIDTVPLDSQAVFPITVKNTGTLSDSIILNIPDSLTSIPGDWMPSLCGPGACYPLPYYVYLGPGSETQSLEIHVETSLNPGPGSINLTVQSRGNPACADTLEFTVYTE